MAWGRLPRHWCFSAKLTLLLSPFIKHASLHFRPYSSRTSFCRSHWRSFHTEWQRKLIYESKKTSACSRKLNRFTLCTRHHYMLSTMRIRFFKTRIWCSAPNQLAIWAKTFHKSSFRDVRCCPSRHHQSTTPDCFESDRKIKRSIALSSSFSKPTFLHNPSRCFSV